MMHTLGFFVFVAALLCAEFQIAADTNVSNVAARRARPAAVPSAARRLGRRFQSLSMVESAATTTTTGDANQWMLAANATVAWRSLFRRSVEYVWSRSANVLLDTESRGPLNDSAAWCKQPPQQQVGSDPFSGAGTARRVSRSAVQRLRVRSYLLPTSPVHTCLGVGQLVQTMQRNYKYVCGSGDVYDASTSAQYLNDLLPRLEQWLTQTLLVSADELETDDSGTNPLPSGKRTHSLFVQRDLGVCEGQLEGYIPLAHRSGFFSSSGPTDFVRSYDTAWDLTTGTNPEFSTLSFPNTTVPLFAANRNAARGYAADPSSSWNSDVDLVVYLTPMFSYYWLDAMPCQFHPITGRPTVIHLNVDPGLSRQNLVPPGSSAYRKGEMFFRIVLANMIGALALKNFFLDLDPTQFSILSAGGCSNSSANSGNFSSVTNSSCVKPNLRRQALRSEVIRFYLRPEGYTARQLIREPLLSLVQSHVGCYDDNVVRGADLEAQYDFQYTVVDNGLSCRLFSFELITADQLDVLVSDRVYGVLQSSGWWLVDWSTPLRERNSFGAREGCSFTSEMCNAPSYWQLPPGAWNCTWNVSGTPLLVDRIASAPVVCSVDTVAASRAGFVLPNTSIVNSTAVTSWAAGTALSNASLFQSGSFCFASNDRSAPSFGQRRCHTMRRGIAQCSVTNYSFALPPRMQYFSSPNTGGTYVRTDYCPIADTAFVSCAALFSQSVPAGSVPYDDGYCFDSVALMSTTLRWTNNDPTTTASSFAVDVPVARKSAAPACFRVTECDAVQRQYTVRAYRTATGRWELVHRCNDPTAGNHLGVPSDIVSSASSDLVFSLPWNETAGTHYACATFESVCDDPFQRYPALLPQHSSFAVNRTADVDAADRFAYPSVTWRSFEVLDVSVTSITPQVIASSSSFWSSPWTASNIANASSRVSEMATLAGWRFVAASTHANCCSNESESSGTSNSSTSAFVEVPWQVVFSLPRDGMIPYGGVLLVVIPPNAPLTCIPPASTPSSRTSSASDEFVDSNNSLLLWKHSTPTIGGENRTADPGEASRSFFLQRGNASDDSSPEVLAFLVGIDEAITTQGIGVVAKQVVTTATVQCRLLVSSNATHVQGDPGVYSEISLYAMLPSAVEINVTTGWYQPVWNATMLRQWLMQEMPATALSTNDTDNAAAGGAPRNVSSLVAPPVPLACGVGPVIMDYTTATASSGTNASDSAPPFAFVRVATSYNVNPPSDDVSPFLPLAFFASPSLFLAQSTPSCGTPQGTSNNTGTILSKPTLSALSVALDSLLLASLHRMSDPAQLDTSVAASPPLKSPPGSNVSVNISDVGLGCPNVTVTVGVRGIEPFEAVALSVSMPVFVDSISTITSTATSSSSSFEGPSSASSDCEVPPSWWSFAYAGEVLPLAALVPSAELLSVAAWWNRTCAGLASGVLPSSVAAVDATRRSFAAAEPRPGRSSTESGRPTVRLSQCFRVVPSVDVAPASSLREMAEQSEACNGTCHADGTQDETTNRGDEMSDLSIHNAYLVENWLGYASACVSPSTSARNATLVAAPLPVVVWKVPAGWRCSAFEVDFVGSFYTPVSSSGSTTTPGSHGSVNALYPHIVVDVMAINLSSFDNTSSQGETNQYRSPSALSSFITWTQLSVWSNSSSTGNVCSEEASVAVPSLLPSVGSSAIAAALRVVLSASCSSCEALMYASLSLSPLRPHVTVGDTVLLRFDDTQYRRDQMLRHPWWNITSDSLVLGCASLAIRWSRWGGQQLVGTVVAAAISASSAAMGFPSTRGAQHSNVSHVPLPMTVKACRPQNSQVGWLVDGFVTTSSTPTTAPPVAEFRYIGVGGAANGSTTTQSEDTRLLSLCFTTHYARPASNVAIATACASCNYRGTCDGSVCTCFIGYGGATCNVCSLFNASSPDAGDRAGCAYACSSSDAIPGIPPRFKLWRAACMAVGGWLNPQDQCRCYCDGVLCFVPTLSGSLSPSRSALPAASVSVSLTKPLPLSTTEMPSATSTTSMPASSSSPSPSSTATQAPAATGSTTFSSSPTTVPSTTTTASPSPPSTASSSPSSGTTPSPSPTGLRSTTVTPVSSASPGPTMTASTQSLAPGSTSATGFPSSTTTSYSPTGPPTSTTSGTVVPTTSSQQQSTTTNPITWSTTEGLSPSSTAIPSSATPMVTYTTRTPTAVTTASPSGSSSAVPTPTGGVPTPSSTATPAPTGTTSAPSTPSNTPPLPPRAAKNATHSSSLTVSTPDDVTMTTALSISSSISYSRALYDWVIVIRSPSMVAFVLWQADVPARSTLPAAVSSGTAFLLGFSLSWISLLPIVYDQPEGGVQVLAGFQRAMDAVGSPFTALAAPRPVSPSTMFIKLSWQASGNLLSLAWMPLVRLRSARCANADAQLTAWNASWNVTQSHDAERVAYFSIPNISDASTLTDFFAYGPVLNEFCFGSLWPTVPPGILLEPSTLVFYIRADPTPVDTAMRDALGVAVRAHAACWGVVLFLVWASSPTLVLDAQLMALLSAAGPRDPRGGCYGPPGATSGSLLTTLLSADALQWALTPLSLSPNVRQPSVSGAVAFDTNLWLHAVLFGVVGVMWGVRGAYRAFFGSDDGITSTTPATKSRLRRLLSWCNLSALRAVWRHSAMLLVTGFCFRCAGAWLNEYQLAGGSAATAGDLFGGKLEGSTSAGFVFSMIVLVVALCCSLYFAVEMLIPANAESLRNSFVFRPYDGLNQGRLSLRDAAPARGKARQAARRAVGDDDDDRAFRASLASHSSAVLPQWTLQLDRVAPHRLTWSARLLRLVAVWLPPDWALPRGYWAPRRPTTTSYDAPVSGDDVAPACIAELCGADGTCRLSVRVTHLLQLVRNIVCAILLGLGGNQALCPTANRIYETPLAYRSLWSFAISWFLVAAVAGSWSVFLLVANPYRSRSREVFSIATSVAVIVVACATYAASTVPYGGVFSSDMSGVGSTSPTDSSAVPIVLVVDALVVLAALYTFVEHTLFEEYFIVADQAALDYKHHSDALDGYYRTPSGIGLELPVLMSNIRPLRPTSARSETEATILQSALVPVNREDSSSDVDEHEDDSEAAPVDPPERDASCALQELLLAQIYREPSTAPASQQASPIAGRPRASSRTSLSRTKSQQQLRRSTSENAAAFGSPSAAHLDSFAAALFSPSSVDAKSEVREPAEEEVKAPRRLIAVVEIDDDVNPLGELEALEAVLGVSEEPASASRATRRTPKRISVTAKRVSRK